MKRYSNKLFDLDNGLTASCHAEDTRYGFRHLAVLFRSGREIAQTKACYYNRTWEAYQYESVLLRLIDKAGLPPAEHDVALARVKNYKEPNPFGAQNALLMLADLLAPNTPEANTLKKSALSTIPGIDFPDDWDTLTEEEKTRRLQLAQATIAKP